MPGDVRLLPSSTAETVRPGGIDPPIFHDAMLMVFVTVKATRLIGEPTVALTGLAAEGCNVVAPANECNAPSEAAAATVERRRLPTGDAATNSSIAWMTRAAGVRCNKTISAAAGNLSLAHARCVVSLVRIFIVGGIFDREVC